MSKSKKNRRSGPYSSEENSIVETLMLLPKELRSKYKKRRIEEEENSRNLELWARKGFISGYDEEDKETDDPWEK